MKKLFLLFVTLLTVCFLPAAYAQTNVFPAEGQNATITGSWTFNGVTSINLVSYTVSTLPAPATVPTGFIVTVTDSLTSGSCTTGGGFQVSLCRNSGLAWVSLVPSGTQVYPPSGIAVSTGSAWAAAATSTNIIALWTAPCNSSTYLRGDGFCQTPTGAGNVSNVGTPTNGQLAQWTSATTIQGVTILPTAAMPALTGDVTNSAGSLATTVGRINGISLASLSSGILKNTTASGTPSIALSTDVIALWSGTCNNNTFLRADGTCQVAGGGGSANPGFDTIASGVNVGASMTVGSGASLVPSGSGIITATTLNGNTFANPGAIGGTTPSTGAFTTITGALTGNVTGNASGSAATFTGNLTGDTTSVAMATTTVKVNGTTVPTNAAADQFLRTTGSAVATWATMPDCQDSAGNHVNYTASTHALSCGTSASGAGTTSFSSLTGSTNTTAAMVLGSGSSLTISGTGTNNATAVNGTTVPVNSSADQVIVTTSSAVGAWESVPNCTDSGGNHINYTTASHAFSCGTSSSGGGSTSFSSITGSTNTTAAMIVGTGASLTVSGSGTINATTLNGTTFASPAAIGTGSPAAITGTTITANTGFVGSLTGNVTGNASGTSASFTGNLTGDTTSVAMATTTVKINGTTVPVNSAADQFLRTTGSAVATWATMPNCIDSAGNHINYTASTHTLSCGTTSSGGGGAVGISGTPSAHQTSIWTNATTIEGIGPGTTGYPLVSAGASSDPSYAQLSLTAGVTGVLPIANGGTNTSSTLTGLVRGGASYTAAELSGDATTSGSNAVTVTKLNGTSLAGLGTGILKNTTGTGVPSIAASADVIGLWSGSCSSSTYLGGGGACGTGTQYALLDWATSSTIGSACTPPSTNGTFVLGYSVTSSAAVQANCNQVGLTSSTISGATSTYTVLYSDAAAGLIIHDVAGSAAVAVTLPTPTTLVNTNPVFVYVNHSAKNDTITPTTWTIQTGTAAATSSLTVPPGASVRVSVDPFNATTWDADMVPSMTGVALPIIVSGIAATPTDALKLLNTTASTVGAPVQCSPSQHLGGHVWNTTGPVDWAEDWIMYTCGASQAGPYSSLFFASSLNGASYGSAKATLNSFGTMSLGTIDPTSGYGLGGSNITLISSTAPTVAGAGCGGAAASITSNNGTAAFKLNIGTSNTGPCTVTMPTATTDWLCQATDKTTTSANVFLTKVVPGGTPATQISLQNYTTAAATHAWTDSDILDVTCTAE